jgi:hypothetical protein
LRLNKKVAMKKIGIVTICDYKNYGNRLQNYAVQEVLKSLGFEAETIRNDPARPNPDDFPGIAERLKNAAKLPLKQLGQNIWIKIRDELNKKELNRLLEPKIKSFKEFTRQNIAETSFKVSVDAIPEDLAAQYDFFVVGSDQIWNPNFRYGSPIDFLAFAPENKRVAFSPSFGISSLPERYVERYKTYLSQMAHLSVREQTGADIIAQLTGRKAEVLVDPTLMLTSEKWMKIAKAATEKPAGKYLLTYFLGEVPGEIRKKVNAISAKSNLEVVQMASLRDKKRFATAPGEFIDYISSAEIIITDSFHGAVFSILFSKPFIIARRKGKSLPMGSRIETLLSKFKMESRKWENMENREDAFEIDFTHIPELLEAERNKVLDYLKKAFKITSPD